MHALWQVSLLMVTGDAEETALAVAEKLDIRVERDGALSGVEIEKLSVEGCLGCFVGWDRVLLWVEGSVVGVLGGGRGKAGSG